MSETFCRVCKSGGHYDGLLFKCSKCSAVHWDKWSVKKSFSKIKKDSDEFKELKQRTLIEAKVPKSKGNYCYKIRLRKQKKYNLDNDFYIGRTGLHPYERYLNHLLGKYSSRYAKSYATAMIEFEGPMKFEESKLREPEWGKEEEQKGFKVIGPKENEVMNFKSKKSSHSSKLSESGVKKI